MNSQRLGVIGVIVVALALAAFAFTQQQQAANNEATAVANAHTAKIAQAEAESISGTAIADANTAATAQAESDALRDTAIADANTAATAQTEADTMRGTAIALANSAATEQSLAQQAQATAVAQANTQATGQAEAQVVESTAVALADFAMTAQAQAEATRADAVETAQAGATEAINQALTATVAMGSAQEQAALAETLASDLEQSQALLATQEALSTQIAATAQTAQEQNVIIGSTATAQAQLIQDAIQEIETFLTETTVPSQDAQGLSPEETVRFLVEDGALPFYGGRVAARLGSTTIDLSGEEDFIEWEPFSGEYTDFIVSVDIEIDTDSDDDRCGLILRLEDDDNFYTLDFDGEPEIYFDMLIDNEWEYGDTSRNRRNLPIQRNGINRLVAVAIQDQFMVYINGEFALQYSDDRLTRGEVGVSATTFGDSDEMSCTFTNSWLWELPDMSVTPTPLPSPSPVAMDIPDLAESFTVRDQSLLIHYPRGWTISEYEQGQVMFYNQLDGTFINLFPSGQIAGVASILENPGGALDAELALRLMTSTIGAMMGEDFPPLAFSEPASFALGPYDALRTAAVSPELDVVAILYPQGDVYIVMFGLCASGELAVCEPVLRTIAENIEYSPQSNL